MGITKTQLLDIYSDVEEISNNRLGILLINLSAVNAMPNQHKEIKEALNIIKESKIKILKTLLDSLEE